MRSRAESVAVPGPVGAIPVVAKKRRRRNVALLAGSLIVGIWGAVAALAPFLAPHSPLDLDVMNRLEPPSQKHPFGTDETGRDNLSRVLYGARITMPIA